MTGGNEFVGVWNIVGRGRKAARRKRGSKGKVVSRAA
jgi:hypothetical protein